MIKAYAAKEQGGKLESYSYDPGELGSNEVEIDVINCGLCHSDISMIDNEWGMTEYPVVPGHEVVGKIVELGSDVKKLKKGDLVGLGWHRGYCGHCVHCSQGDKNLCDNAQPTIAHHGGFGEKVRAKEDSVVPIPDGLDPDFVGPLFCGGITVFNPMYEYGLSPTAKVGVIGIGGLGHIAVQFLNAWGCEVTAFSSSPSKKDSILDMGAHHVINSTSDQDLKDAEGKFDFILSTVNVNLDWNLYLNTLKARGRLHFVGMVSDDLKIQLFPLLAKQRSISASPVGSPATIGKMLEFAANHDIAPIIETYEMKNINEAIERLKSGKARYRIILKN